MRGVYKIAFKFDLKGAFSCNKTKRMITIEKGLRKIDYELNVVNFIRFQLQTRSLLKQLFTISKRKAARDLKSHLYSDQPSASDDSGNIDPDPFEHEELPAQISESAIIVKPISNTNQLDKS